ncbi:MAG: hypothetical protein NTW19_03580 [Planctomycetota bacterium]|nr:hypothetical protein [Planctomycetota bacterium]
MRDDMDKLIVERPRVRSHLKAPNHTKKRQQMPPEHWPTRESIRRTDKYLNENLAPLRRFLEGSVGRPWSKVHAELAEHIDRNNTVQAHIWQHIDQYVDRHPLFVERGHAYRVGHGGHRWGSLLYVDPATGLLRRNKFSNRAWWRLRTAPGPRFKELGPDRYAGQIKGVWFEIRTARIADAPVGARDVLSGTVVALADGTRQPARGEAWFGNRELYAVRKRALNSKEIKALGLAPQEKLLPNIVR